jgi:hypothetical protein
MNTFIDILFIFIFIYTLLLFRVPDVTNDSYIQHKFLLFVLLFAYNYVITVISKLTNNCKIDYNEVANKSMEVAISAVIGYSLFVDLTLMDWSRGFMEELYATQSVYTIYLMITIVMILFIALIKVIRLLFNDGMASCVK